MLEDGVISVNGQAISLDDASAQTCFVSHAHSDHTSALSKKRSIIASEETFLIAGMEPQSHSVQGIKLLPAGHMLGARQLFAKLEGGTFCYTGDFSLHDAYSAKGAKIAQCDTLMIDSTYCLPRLNMPNRWQVMSSMEKFVKANQDSALVFGAYTTGKCQELVAFLNRECKVAPIVTERAAKVCKAYSRCGIRLDFVAEGTAEANEAMRRAFVSIKPPSEVNFSYGAKLSEALGMPVKTAVATGWAAVTKFPVDAPFALSDHADFSDTMRYIHESGAKKVICANSNSEEAARYLRSAGIDAEAKCCLGKSRQETLAIGW